MSLLESEEQPICPICNKPKPPKDFTPWSDECDAGYTEIMSNGKRHPGFCDTKRLNLPWPPLLDNAR